MNIQREINEGISFLQSIIEKKNEDKRLKRKFLAFDVIGSAGYLPAEKCHDVDFLVMVWQGGWEKFVSDYLNDSVKCSSEEYSASDNFTAVRQGYKNFIVTDDWEFYQKYLAAYRVCKALRIEDKETRVLIHCLVRDFASIEDAKLEAAEYAPKEMIRKEVISDLSVVAKQPNAFGRSPLWGAH